MSDASTRPPDRDLIATRSPAKPSATTKTPVVKNPATPGVQRPNTPTGRATTRHGRSD